MGDRTAIEWTDATWNPMTGCTKVTAGCDHCYAAVVAERKTRDVYLRRLPVKDTPANRADPFAPRFWPERLGQPLKWREPKRIFVNSMSDVFHAHFSPEQIQQVFAVMNQATHHQFQVLTKRPERAARLAGDLEWTETFGWGRRSRTCGWRSEPTRCGRSQQRSVLSARSRSWARSPIST
jgi:protein gp37